MKRMTWLLAPLVAIAAALGWLLFREEPPLPGPSVVPKGESSRQILPGPEGEPEVWTFTRREAERDESVAELLPPPSPRATETTEQTDTARALNAQALEAWKTGRLREALALFESAIQADPEDWRPRADYGRLRVMMTDYETAGPHLERAAQLNPDSARVWLDLYSYYQRTLQLERAFHAYARAQGLTDGQSIVQDETGLWRLEGDSIYP